MVFKKTGHVFQIILITGANGYIGQRLAPVLVEKGHRITCCVRSRQRFATDHLPADIQIIETDFSSHSPQRCAALTR